MIFTVAFTGLVASVFQQAIPLQAALGAVAGAQKHAEARSSTSEYFAKSPVCDRLASVMWSEAVPVQADVDLAEGLALQEPGAVADVEAASPMRRRRPD